MSIEQQPGKRPLIASSPPTWGEVAPTEREAAAVRFVLEDRVVCFPSSEIKRWEHVAGEPETLTINVGSERVAVEGRDLAAVRAALDLRRLCELRANGERPESHPGPRVRQITIERT